MDEDLEWCVIMSTVTKTFAQVEYVWAPTKEKARERAVRYWEYRSFAPTILATTPTNRPTPEI